ncbi:MAG TPA: Uma2 family endonuclease [Cytophagales bacterium]|nr:Uma2 family endonuclease [Cytophagales bacterium]HAP62233.1 Uma2 family endonuclease [Cytophagales bacterium]
MTSPAISLKERYTYKDYLTWGDEERWELIDGVAYNMSPGPNTKHQFISQELSGIIWSFLKGKSCRVVTAPFDVRLPKAGQSEDETDTVVQPDVAVFCDPKKFVKQGAIGAPDWVIEVLSPSTATKDLHLKGFLYQSHGVREYWIVDPEKEQVIVHRLNEELQRYTLPQFYDRTDSLTSAVLPELTISLDEIFKAAA